jgi:hypothetical protein
MKGIIPYEVGAESHSFLILILPCKSSYCIFFGSLKSKKIGQCHSVKDEIPTRMMNYYKENACGKRMINCKLVTSW